MMHWFMAALGPKTLVQLQGTGAVDVAVSPDDASVGYRLTNGGDEQRYQGSGGSYATLDQWLLIGSAGDYEARLTVNSGTAPTGSSTGAWLALSTTRAWTLSQSGVGADSNSCTIEIRNASTLEVLATDTVTMSVEVEI